MLVDEARGCHMKTCLFGIVLYVVANMPFQKLMEVYFVMKKNKVNCKLLGGQAQVVAFRCFSLILLKKIFEEKKRMLPTEKGLYTWI